STDFEAELDPIPVSTWAAFGIAPRPAVVLRMPVKKPRALPEIPRVGGPLVVCMTAVRAVKGVVLGPGEQPLADARVTLPSLTLSTRTDARGCFGFETIPAEPRTIEVRVEVKGTARSVTQDLDA